MAQISIGIQWSDDLKMNRSVLNQIELDLNFEKQVERSSKFRPNPRPI